MFGQIEEYFRTSLDRWTGMLAAHVEVSLLALAIAAALAVPAGILCARYERLKGPLTGLFGALRVVPSLAILLLMLPVLGTGTAPAAVALVLLAVPPVLMNTVAGLESVPAPVLETAAAMGMEERQIWQKVRLPLAMPMILAGLKTAAVEIVASAALAAKIGAGGLGELIFTGIGLFRTDLLLIGGGSVALLSLLTGVLFELLDKLLLKYKNV